MSIKPSVHVKDYHKSNQKFKKSKEYMVKYIQGCEKWVDDAKTAKQKVEEKLKVYDQEAKVFDNTFTQYANTIVQIMALEEEIKDLEGSSDKSDQRKLKKKENEHKVLDKKCGDMLNTIKTTFKKTYDLNKIINGNTEIPKLSL